MKNENGLQIKTTAFKYTIEYNSETAIFSTTSLTTAIRVAKDCAKLADHECCYKVYARNYTNYDGFYIAEYKITK